MSDEQGHPARMPDPGTPFPIVQAGDGIEMGRSIGGTTLTVSHGSAPNLVQRVYDLEDNSRLNAVWQVVTGSASGTNLPAIDTLAWVYTDANSSQPTVGLLSLTATVGNVPTSNHWGRLQEGGIPSVSSPGGQFTFKMTGLMQGVQPVEEQLTVSGTDVAIVQAMYLLYNAGKHATWTDEDFVAGINAKPTGSWGVQEPGHATTGGDFWGHAKVTGSLTVGLQLSEVAT